MRFVFLMDPIESVKARTDTSFIFMLGAQRAQHEVWFCATRNISILDGKVHMSAERLKVIEPQGLYDLDGTENPQGPFEVLESRTLIDCEIDAVFIRTDPPFDSGYLMNTWMLDHLPDTTAIINSPQAIRDVNEKIWCAKFTEFTPRTLITSNMDLYLKFLTEEKQVIVKPCDGFGGLGIFRIEEGKANVRVAFETLSNRGQEEVIVQAYVKEASLGDKRILLLNGEILGAVLRVHGADDHRNNFYAGGSAIACEITEREQEICDALKPWLQEKGLYFTGIDFLGDKLTEVNVTSPTCLQEMNRLYDLKLEDKVVAFVENLIISKRK
ncbi:glutathione synthase [Lentisphaera profundi]|uniref:Glutathione synthetase n=1 Tax=Lentisphaera profundi TaxID=1658616 RepID=A0ABY7VQY0_9BACT|nr:glutathione synthase [Lentisphaera profundi]WDE96097.1 glutathione synthase [Lentisphaera profundi]